MPRGIGNERGKDNYNLLYHSKPAGLDRPFKPQLHTQILLLSVLAIRHDHKHRDTVTNKSIVTTYRTTNSGSRGLITLSSNQKLYKNQSLSFQTYNQINGYFVR